MESRNSLVRIESRENIDYVYVVHKQLDRIAQIRTRLYESVGTEERYPLLDALMLGRVQHYLAAVETLYSVLHPSLRGGAQEWLSKARRAIRICEQLQSLLMMKRKPEGGLRQDRTGKVTADAQKLEEEIRKLREELLSLLPPEHREEARGSLIHEIPLRLIDAALEEILRRLDAAGLLMRAEKIRVGVA